MKKRILKHLPNIKFNKYVYIVLIVLFIVLIGRLKRQKDGGLKLGGEMLLTPNYDQKVELSVEERLSYEAEVQKYDDLINNFVPGTGKEIDLGNGIKGITDESQPSQSWFLEKAKNLALLGKYTDAIKTVHKAMSYDPTSLPPLEALARLYRDASAYQKALDTFQEVITIDPQQQMIYMNDIIQMYIYLGDAETAGDQYVEFIKMWGEKNLVLINQIRELKGMKPLKN